MYISVCASAERRGRESLPDELGGGPRPHRGVDRVLEGRANRGEDSSSDETFSVEVLFAHRNVTSEASHQSSMAHDTACHLASHFSREASFRRTEMKAVSEWRVPARRSSTRCFASYFSREGQGGPISGVRLPRQHRI